MARAQPAGDGLERSAPGEALEDAGENRVAMAEALVDEIDHPDTGLVSRDFLRPELQTLRADLIGTVWRVVLTVFGIQVVLAVFWPRSWWMPRSSTGRRSLTPWRMWC